MAVSQSKWIHVLVYILSPADSRASHCSHRRKPAPAPCRMEFWGTVKCVFWSAVSVLIPVLLSRL